MIQGGRRKCDNCGREEKQHYCDLCLREEEDGKEQHYCEYCTMKHVEETEEEAGMIERGEELPVMCEDCRKPKSEFENYYTVKDTVLLCEACYEKDWRQTNK